MALYNYITIKCLRGPVEKRFFLTFSSRIVEKNPKKFKIGTSEVAERRQFVERAKAFVKVRVLLVMLHF